MGMTLEQIEKKIDIDKQLEKCLRCPCVSDGNFIGCFNCKHFKKDCADSDCSTSHINRTDNLKLCCADDCALTWVAIALLSKEDSK